MNIRLQKKETHINNNNIIILLLPFALCCKWALQEQGSTARVLPSA